jgi:hypothetical protein
MSVLGCTAVDEPEPPPPAAPTAAQVDSLIADTDHRITLLAKAPGAGTGPECNGALRDYALAVAAYAWAVNAVRLAPTASNIAWASLMALAVVSATANVHTHCFNDPTRPA